MAQLTVLNSRVLWVASITLLAYPIDAIYKSFGRIRVPVFFRSERI